MKGKEIKQVLGGFKNTKCIFNSRKLDSIDAVCLHHTAGASWESSMNWVDHINNINYEGNTGVSVHYYISRAGNIYNTVPIQYWGWHTGTGARNGLDKRSICIELANYGYLKGNRKEGFTNCYNQKFININNKSIYKSEDWRNFNYFETYKDEQIKSMLFLLFEIGKYCNNLDLSMSTFLCPSLKDTDAKEVKGIFSHTNVRDGFYVDGKSSGKWDLSPAILQHFVRGRILDFNSEEGE